MTQRFLNPYHFVPLGKGAVPHEEKSSPTFSGRIDIKVTVEQPVIVPTSEAIIHGSSWRGMISTLAEAATDSRMRVLQNRVLSRRASRSVPAERLSALGVVVRLANGEHRLRPLTLPAHSLDGDNEPQLDKRWQRVFAHRLGGKSVPPLPIYLNASDAGKALYQPLEVPQALSAQLDYCHEAVRCYWKTKELTPGEKWLIGSQYRADSGTHLDGWRHINAKSKHHHFLPDPKANLNGEPAIASAAEEGLLDIDEAWSELVRDLRALQDSHGGKPPPFGGGFGLCVEKAQKAWRIEVRPGVLLYFDVCEDGQVRVLRPSAIWRVRDVDSVLEALVPSSHRPWDGTGTSLSIVERLFGVVGRDERTTNAYRGRVRVGSARFNKTITVHLPGRANMPLASPKPNYPAFYLAPRGEEVSRKKTDLAAKHDKLQIQGWKIYLRSERGPAVCSGNGAKRKAIGVGNSTCFPIHFRDLTAVELGMLLWCLAPTDARANPVEGFRHRIGQARPLGYGVVKLEPSLKILDLSRYGGRGSTISVENAVGVFCTRYGESSRQREALVQLHRPIDDVEIHYPAFGKKPDRNWFLKNEKSALHQTLGLDDSGTPLPLQE
jgi:CRISPR-associated protein (TIGR03986 family)